MVYYGQVSYIPILLTQQNGFLQATLSWMNFEVIATDDGMEGEIKLSFTSAESNMSVTWKILEDDPRFLDPFERECILLCPSCH